jgi:hypothetical protein
VQVCGDCEYENDCECKEFYYPLFIEKFGGERRVIELMASVEW